MSTILFRIYSSLHRNHLREDCSDTAHSGQWQRSLTCEGISTLHAFTDQSTCAPMDRHDDKKTESSKYHAGYIYQTCTSDGSQRSLLSVKPAKKLSEQDLLDGDEPTPEPSVAPSVAPSAEPTTEPTAEPTAGDTPVAAPTLPPVPAPSATPSATPTVHPTLSPTVQTSPVVSFTSTITLTNVASSTLDADSQYAVRSASAMSMNIDISHVTYVSATAAFSVSAMSANARPILHNVHHEDVRLATDKQAILSDKTLHIPSRTLAGNTLEVTIVTKISLASTTYSSVDDLYDELSEMLEDAVDDNDFTTYLRSAGAAQLTSANATEVDSEDPVITNPPNSGDDKSGESGLSDGVLAGIIIGALAGAVLLCMLCYKYASCGKTANTRDQDYLNASDHESGHEMSQWSPLTGHSRV